MTDNEIVMKTVGVATWDINFNRPAITYPNYASSHTIGIKIENRRNQWT